MNRDTLEQIYRDELHPTYAALAARTNGLLAELLTTKEIDVAQIEHRAKDVESVLDKYDRKRYEKPLDEIKDFAGVRIITYYKDDNARVAELIGREFSVDADHSADKVRELEVTEFGYNSLHLVVSLSEPRKSLAEWSRFADFPVEIQIRSVLQHAWASISHKLDYKITSEVPTELRRQLFRLSALLELADEDFASLRDRSQNLVTQYRQEVDRGELNIPLNLDSLMQFLKERIDLRYWAEVGQEAGMEWVESEYNQLRPTLEVSPLLATLQAVGISNIRGVQSLLDEMETNKPTVQEWLREFVRNHESATSEEFGAVGADVLMLSVSFLRAQKIITDDFNWNGVWTSETEAVLKKTIKDIANQREQD